ncbi:Rv1678 family membrane protein [Nonomuraea sp. NPDC004354]|uniref:Rv1678 family membrane protein n=1 Tax=Nonomuraea sp. NPDC003804 TaxID=3154547 RepID=UPI0033A8F15E
MRAPDRFALALGVASVLSAVFVFVHGDPWQLVKMTGQAVPVAIVLGVLACLAGALRRPPMQTTAGALFVLSALLVLAELAFGFSLTAGSASTASLWLGLGIGLVSAGRTPREP